MNIYSKTKLYYMRKTIILIFSLFFFVATGYAQREYEGGNNNLPQPANPEATIGDAASMIIVAPVDLLMYIDGMNDYIYAHNNLIIYIDPSGEVAPLVAIGFGTLRGALIAGGVGGALIAGGDNFYEQRQSGDCFDLGYFGGSIVAGVVSGVATTAIITGALAMISAATGPIISAATGIIATGIKAIPRLGKALSYAGNKLSNFFKSIGRNANKGGKPLSPEASQSNSGSNSLSEGNINYYVDVVTNKDVPHIFKILF